MTRRPLRLLLFFVCIAFFIPSHAHDNKQMQQFINSSNQLIKHLATDLKMELGKTMQSQGPGAAINTCKISAPAITHELSHGAIRVKRTSLKLRNPSNKPNAWERETLELFSKQLESGVTPDQLTRFQITEDNNTETYRYMRAIPTQGICLTCHGDKNTLPETVKSMLDSHYPQDQATGFNVGDLRGAFSTTKIIEK